MDPAARFPERQTSGSAGRNYLSTQNPCASMPSATLNLLRKRRVDRRLGMLALYGLHTEAKRCTGRNPGATRTPLLSAAPVVGLAWRCWTHDPAGHSEVRDL